EELYMDLSDPEIGKYQWSPADNISCSTCPDPVFKAMETTAYSVAVTDVNECFTLSYPFNLTVEKKYSVDVPLAFTPNGDGINDKDRKSTRLNSSHVKISYAVFCLKKKNK